MLTASLSPNMTKKKRVQRFPSAGYSCRPVGTGVDAKFLSASSHELELVCKGKSFLRQTIAVAAR